MDALRYSLDDFDDMCRFITRAAYERGADIGYLGEEEMSSAEFVCAAVNEWVVTPVVAACPDRYSFDELYCTHRLYEGGFAIENENGDDLFEFLPDLLDVLLSYGVCRLSPNDERLAHVMDDFSRMFCPPAWQMEKSRNRQ